jgi:hypothetical protein
MQQRPQGSPQPYLYDRHLDGVLAHSNSRRCLIRPRRALTARLRHRPCCCCGLLPGHPACAHTPRVLLLHTRPLLLLLLLLLLLTLCQCCKGSHASPCRRPHQLLSTSLACQLLLLLLLQQPF